jgi:sec-independent protein translocase protein TatB
MNLFGIGALELLFILIIALVIVGPRDIEKHARSAGRFLNRFYRSDTWHLIRDTSRNLRSLPSRLAREAALEELEEIKRSIEDTAGDLNQVQQRLEQTEKKLSGTSPAAGKPEANSTDKSSAPGETPNTENDH